MSASPDAASPRITPEFSRPVAADSIGSQGQRRDIVAEPAERDALARRFGLLSLDRLSATLELHRHAVEIVGLSGYLIADAVQSCVVSLAPVPVHIESEIDVSYSAAAAEGADVELDPLGPDAPEPLINGEIDLGETVAQQLAVALDPYPRAPGVAHLAPGDIGATGGETGEKRPFAALAALKRRP